jgi:hypothetical protein
MPKKPVKPKPKSDEQWADCPRRERAKVPNINLDIKDLVNPCELAKQYGVPLSQLRAISGGKDAKTNLPLNDFVVATRRGTPRVLVARKPK